MTEPIGFKEQAWFWNATLEIGTQLEPLLLLKKMKSVEIELGREKTMHWGPRIIDIDILFYQNIIYDHPRLCIPHPYLHLRRFVLIPLKEIAACFIHPVFNKNIHQLLSECPDNTQVNWLMFGSKLFKIAR